MAQVKRKTSTKRFGTRYGRSLKDKLAPIEESSRRTYKCPYCSKLGVRRQAAGIWYCKKCNAKFAGKAYTLTKKKIVREEFEDLNKVEETQELPDEMVSIAKDSEENADEMDEAVKDDMPEEDLSEDDISEDDISEEDLTEEEPADKKEE